MCYRALALSVAMMVYGKEEGADSLIEQLSKDRGQEYHIFTTEVSSPLLPSFLSSYPLYVTSLFLSLFYLFVF